MGSDAGPPVGVPKIVIVMTDQPDSKLYINTANCQTVPTPTSDRDTADKRVR